MSYKNRDFCYFSAFILVFLLFHSGCNSKKAQDKVHPSTEKSTEPTQVRDDSQRPKKTLKRAPPLIPGNVGASHLHKELDVRGWTKDRVIEKFGKPSKVFEGNDLPGWPLPPFPIDATGNRLDRGGLPEGVVMQWVIYPEGNLGFSTFFFDKNERVLLGVKSWGDL